MAYVTTAEEIRGPARFVFLHRHHGSHPLLACLTPDPRGWDLPEDVKLAVLGSEDASRRIIQSLHPLVFSTIHRFLGSGFAQDVEDIAQEIFLKVFRHLQSFDPERGVKLTTWVFSIARNHCFDILKRRKATPASLDNCPEPEASRQQRPSASVLNWELGQKIEDAIWSLRPSDRRVFVLREYKGLGYEAIAELTGMPEGTVKSKLHRAKTALRQELAPYIQDPVGG